MPLASLATSTPQKPSKASTVPHVTMLYMRYSILYYILYTIYYILYTIYHILYILYTIYYVGRCEA